MRDQVGLFAFSPSCQHIVSNATTEHGKSFSGFLAHHKNGGLAERLKARVGLKLWSLLFMRLDATALDATNGLRQTHAL